MALKILFETLGSEAWLGGVHYLKNLGHAIRLAEAGHELIHFGYFNQKLYGDEFVADGQLIWNSPYRRLPNRMQGFLLKLRKRAPWLVDGLTRVLKLGKIPAAPDVIFHVNTKDMPIRAPRISWIPDFQHLVRPDFFSAEEISTRDHIFASQVRGSDIILLSSKDAEAAFRRFFPGDAGKARVYRFVSKLAAIPGADEVRATLQDLGLPDKFIYLPNQFWAHKNHLVVVEALGLLKSTNPEIKVVMSGALYDHRWPNHGTNVVTEIARRGVRDMAVLLGLIPYAQVQALLYGCHAVLNPSMYEGWSTTVEEAKALRKLILASDIGVHREQLVGTDAIFFAPDQASDLAQKLRQIWELPSRSVPSNEELLSQNERACREAGRDFLRICRDLTEGAR